MNMISNETLNAYLDGELDDSERYEVTDAIINSPEVKTRLEEIQQARKLYIGAFSNPPVDDAVNHTSSIAGRNNRQLISQALAASLLVAVSFFAGLHWSGNNHAGNDTNQIATFTSIDTIEKLSSGKNVPDKGYKALVHFEKFSKHDALKTLARIDRILAKARRNNINARIEVVMQGQGLGLIRTDTSPIADEIRELLAKHNNIVIAACNKTLERLKMEKGIEAQLLPDVLIVPSALDQILNRLQHDWLYVKA